MPDETSTPAALDLQRVRVHGSPLDHYENGLAGRTLCGYVAGVIVRHQTQKLMCGVCLRIVAREAATDA